MPPPGDDEVGRHERELEHEEEHEEVEGEEAPHHCGLEEQDPGEVAPGVLAVAAEDDGEREEQPGEQHEEDGDAVHPQVPVHAEARAGVVVVRDELEPAVVHLHRHQDRDGEAQRHQRDDQGQRVDELLVQAPVEGEQAQDDGARRRQQHQQREEGEAVGVGRHPHHVRLSMKAMMRAMPSAMPSA